MKLTQKDKQILLKFSRLALEYIFTTGKNLDVKASEVPKNLKEKRATFVTLNKNNHLRGCIGKLMPMKELYMDVLENTYSAAFNDPRFPQLTREELKQITIEISVLDTPKKLKYKNPNDLLAKLELDKPGVILEMGMHSATFLPQVWEETPTAKDFLEHLCEKAGLPKDMWKNKNMKFSTYEVVKFSE